MENNVTDLFSSLERVDSPKTYAITIVREDNGEIISHSGGGGILLFHEGDSMKCQAFGGAGSVFHCAVGAEEAVKKVMEVLLEELEKKKKGD